MINLFSKIGSLSWIVLALVACEHKHKHKPAPAATQRYLVNYETTEEKLLFTGTIEPLRESAITSPIEAVIESIAVDYGQLVKQHNLVITLNSTELQKQYNDSLTDYLKAKDNYNVTQAKFTGTKNLWQAGLLSKNNYLSEKSSLDTTRVSLMQAKQKLMDTSEKTDNTDNNTSIDLSALNIADFDKVKQALTTKHNLIRLKAPMDGILLYPPKSGEDKATHLATGAAIKAGQVIALIGDLTGISVEIDVPEIDIDKIHPGMKAFVTSTTLNNQALSGELVSVSAQALSSASSALASFHALVRVKKLTKIQQKWIKVGMSATVELIANKSKQITVPIAAVTQYHGKSLVQIQDKTGAITSKQVTTGNVLNGKVIILSGLMPGDMVIYHG